MGFDLDYQTTEKISPALQREIIAETKSLDLARSWVQCDGPCVQDDDGFLMGSSRLSPSDPDGFDEAKSSDLPLGRLPDLLQALCELSARHGIDWEITHDAVEGQAVGVIRYGIADDGVLDTFEALMRDAGGNGR